MSKMVAVVMAGGSGTRLWPFSRQMFPKQFMTLEGNQSLLQATITRLNPVVAKDNVWIITSSSLATGSGYQEVKDYNYVVEPAARNTAPAIGLMAAYMADFEGDPIMAILPADHLIRNVPAFHEALQTAFKAAETGKIVTFGIQPTHPETGFGYIRAGTEGDEVKSVEAFVEKPDLVTAQQYLLAGNYTWNSGMFVAKASTLLHELKLHAPEISKVLEKMRTAWKAGEDWKKVVAENFESMPSDSIDYAVMEKSANVVVVECNIGWSDIGSWDAVYDMGKKDAENNVINANETVVVESSGNLIMGRERVIATIGVKNLCIIDTADALLVADRNQTQKVKNVVDDLKKRGGEVHIFHRTVRRPWGSFTVLEDNVSGYKIKRIEVIPGGRLSLQSHKHRSEHWVVVNGTATVTNGEDILTLNSGQSTYIPLGNKHRLENLGAAPVQIVEVQVGNYLGEDDIIRYDDIYGR